MWIGLNTIQYLKLLELECKYHIVFDWIEIIKSDYRRNFRKKNTQKELLKS
jgi:hypothetical protein